MNASHVELSRSLIHEAGIGSRLRHIEAIGGGSINSAYKLVTETGSFFLKVNSATSLPGLFKHEVAGLQTLAATELFRTPKVIQTGESGHHQYLLMEWIEEQEPGKYFWSTFGEALAALHSKTGERFGADTNNYMGAVPQDNTGTEDWVTFFRDRRLAPLISKLLQKGLLENNEATSIEVIYPRLTEVFESDCRPSLLHGDLWSGNFIPAARDQAVLIDPAVYYGNPAMDLGLTTLFGGFPQRFYEAYNSASPLPTNANEQWEVANLYPLLIHMLLFGRSYFSQVRSTIQQFA